MSDFIKILQREKGLNTDRVTLLVAGLGANIAHVVGTRVANVSAIVAINPAWSFFGMLSRGDAKYVQVIHTSLIIGAYAAVGDADFYINKGYWQPGCGILDPICDYHYGGKIFYESLCVSNITGCREYSKNDCGYVMGGEPLHIYKGIFTIST